MSKTMLSFLIALGLTVAGMLINLAVYLSGGVMPLVYTIYGGEMIADMGFGLQATYIYSMLPDGATTRSLRFDIVSFVICLLLLFLIVFLIVSIVSRFRKH